jgi:CheY-like chemotaxis protein
MQTPTLPSSSIVEVARRVRPDRRKTLPTLPDAHPGDLNLQGTQVLIVDEPEQSQPLIEAFGALGCEVRTVRTASDALGMLTTFAAHAVIVEVVLPGMSGLLLTRVLKADPATRDLVVVALSHVNGPAVEHVAKEAGCIAYLRKPIAASVIVRTVAHYLERQR